MSITLAMSPQVSPAANFSIQFRRCIGCNGEAQGILPPFANDVHALIELYRAMVVTRLFDEKAVALQRTGRLGTYASSLGQEAVGVGVASAMRQDDVLVPSFREQGAMLWRGVTMAELLLYWGGDERGSDFKTPRQDFPICIPVGTQFPHAVGVATAMQLRKEQRVAVVVGGDGATSKGDFYEAINIAGVWKSPVIFVINNNQWAISMPRSAQSAAETLAQKAVAAGIRSEQVDGNDVVSVRTAMDAAIERARRGEGPSLIEAVTYRLSDHTTADDARRYRSDAEVTEHWKDEPIVRMRAHLASRGAWTKEAERNLLAECRSRIEKAVDEYLSTKPAQATDMIDYLFEKMPLAISEQRVAIDRAEGGGHG